jgi:hypothetical protein
MNKQRRTKLKNAISYLTVARDTIKDVKIEEEFAFDNYPENLQCSIKGCDMEENIDDMEDILDKINDTIDLVNDVIYK